MINMHMIRPVRNRYMMKGSLTVEASMLIPFLFFVLASVVLMIMNCHNSLVLESNIMMESEAEVMAEKEASATELLSGRWTARSEGSGTTYVMMPGISKLTGGDLVYSSRITSLRVNYVDDWYRSVFLKRNTHE